MYRQWSASSPKLGVLKLNLWSSINPIVGCKQHEKWKEGLITFLRRKVSREELGRNGVTEVTCDASLTFLGSEVSCVEFDKYLCVFLISVIIWKLCCVCWMGDVFFGVFFCISWVESDFWVCFECHEVKKYQCGGFIVSWICTLLSILKIIIITFLRKLIFEWFKWFVIIWKMILQDYNWIELSKHNCHYFLYLICLG